MHFAGRKKTVQRGGGGVGGGGCPAACLMSWDALTRSLECLRLEVAARATREEREENTSEKCFSLWLTTLEVILRARATWPEKRQTKKRRPAARIMRRRLCLIRLNLLTRGAAILLLCVCLCVCVVVCIGSTCVLPESRVPVVCVPRPRLVTASCCHRSWLRS